MMDTSTSLPPFVTPTLTSLPDSSISPTFSNIMDQPITCFFPSQSTKGEQSITDGSQDGDDVMISLADIQFDPEEDNILYHMIMYEKENLNFKVEDLRNEMTKEVVKLDQNYSNIHTKIDIIADVVTKVFDFYNSLVTKVELKSAYHSKVFAKLEELLGSLKESLSRIIVSPSSSISQESLSTLFSSLENNLKVEIAPLLRMVNLMPTNAPHVSQVV
ncbi:unnamed protein product [Lactuca saligna]|uniref:Uncharacterized protein n=1 Tax=Lactuca saligna TaxID=75948 RepID=A0AA35Y3H5_LACSI|nr:unnamed protein product [Lactuca saligna]